MVDWTQIVSDYILFIAFLVVVALYMGYKYYQKYAATRLERRNAERVARNLQPAAIQPQPQEPIQAPPRMPEQPVQQPVQTGKLESYYKDTDEEPVRPRRKIEKDFQDVFNEVLADSKTGPEKQKDVMNALSELTREMRTSSELLQGTLEDDLETLKKKLDTISNRKNEIKTYGQLLGELFEKYKHREKQLTLMILGLERLEEKREEEARLEQTDE
jgi:hypothetical protein